jgi:general transcription factor 3C polypeptide 1
LEPESISPDVYPFVVVDEKSPDDDPLGLGIKGSCSTYSSRKDITDVARKCENVLTLLQDFEDRRLVLVASQVLRGKALLGEQFSHLLLESLGAMPWSLVERIGRSREEGEITQGKLSLAMTNESPKALFYWRKELMRLGLLRKQVHCQRNTKGMNQNVS